MRFIISVEVEVDNGSPELEHAAECAGSGFLERLEARLDQQIQDLRKKLPECNFKVGSGDNGEEWKES